MPSPEHRERLLQRIDLRFKAFQHPRFVQALYVLQASLSLDALLTFWDHDPMQTTFGGDTTFLEERLIILESLYNHTVDPQSPLKLPDREPTFLPFLMKQFIRATCISLQDVTLARVPMRCVQEAYRLRFGDVDDHICRLYDDFQQVINPCFTGGVNIVKMHCLSRLGKICGNDVRSQEAAQVYVADFWEVSDHKARMWRLECLLMRAALQPQLTNKTRPNRDLLQLGLEGMRQACLSYMYHHGVDCNLEETGRLMGTKLNPGVHLAWKALWAPEDRAASSSQRLRSCFWGSWLRDWKLLGS